MSFTIEHRPERGRFQARIDGLLCIADYRLEAGVMSMVHTEVPPGLQGRGIAAALVQAALDYAQAHALTVRPLCSYVRGYMQRHPQTQALRA